MNKVKTILNNILSQDIAPSFPVVQTGNTLTISTYGEMPDNSYENWAYSFDDILYVEKEWTDFQNGSLQIDLDGTESAIYFRGVNNSILSSLKAENSLQSSDLFSITFDDSTNFSDEVKSQVIQGFLKWSDLISGIKPNNPSDPTVPHTIDVTIKDFTEVSETVGFATITDTETVESLTFAKSGEISLNNNVLTAYSTKFLEVDGNQISVLTSIVAHEAAHILGLGTLWENRGFVQTHSDGLKYYNGVKALGEYKTIFTSWLGSSDFIGIPIEDNGGAGTAGSHPDEGFTIFNSFTSDYVLLDGVIHPGLRDELNTGFMTEDNYMPLSRISVGFADDLGFVVDYDQADNFVAHDPPSTPTSTPAPPAEGDGITMYFENTNSVSLPIAQIGWGVNDYKDDGPNSSITIDWGDGNTQTLTKGQEGVITKTYASNSGVKKVNITGHLVKYGTYDLIHQDASTLTAVPGSNANMTKLVIKGMDFLEDASFAFYNTYLLETVDLTEFKSPSLEICNHMFALESLVFQNPDGNISINPPSGNPALSSIDISSMSFLRVKYLNDMFRAQKNLETIVGVANIFIRYGNDFAINNGGLSNLNTSSASGGMMPNLDGIFSGCDSLASLDLSSFGFAHQQGQGYTQASGFNGEPSALTCIYDSECEALSTTWNAPFMKTESNKPQWDSFKPYREPLGQFCNNPGDHIEYKFSPARLAETNKTVTINFSHHLLHWAQDSYIELDPNSCQWESCWGPDPDSEVHVYIDWDDGNGDQEYAWSTSASFTYPDSNTERAIKISGDLSWVSCLTASSGKISGMRSLESAKSMFECSNNKQLDSLDLSTWDSINIITIEKMFKNQNLHTLSNSNGEFTGLSNFSSKKLINCDEAFYKCTMPAKMDLNHMDVSKVRYMNEMFRDKYSGWGTGADYQGVPTSEGGPGVKMQLEISEWRPVNLINASEMLRGFFEVPNLIDWETPHLRDFIWNGHDPYYSAFLSEMRSNAPSSWNIPEGGPLVPHWFNWS